MGKINPPTWRQADGFIFLAIGRIELRKRPFQPITAAPCRSALSSPRR
jgi:hypothetical protein